MVRDGQPLVGIGGSVVKKKRGVVTACIAATKYELIHESIKELGMACLQEEDSASHAYLVWSDSVVQPDRVQDLKCYQRINHFPGMAEICRKDYLARNMAKMSRARPDEYHFVPRTWIIPSEYNLLVLHWKDMRKKYKKPATFIIKPANGAMGNGIHLFRNPERIVPHDHLIVQEYLERPFLLDDYKIDLRLYVLVTHCDPLRAFLYGDGLVRLGTEKYASPTESNVDSLYMHLTNYSVNKYNENFERHIDVDRGSKRSVKYLMNYLRSHGYDTTTLWRTIIDLVVKTLIVVSPYLLHSYRMCRPGQPPHADSVCFEILGFDILLDRKLKPWLLEVNRSPSFGADERIDHDVKSGVVKDALRLVNIRASDKSRNMARQKAEARRRLLKPHKHLSTTSGLSNAAKRCLVLNRRKEELKERLSWARKHAAREEHENKNMNNYIRIFPSCDNALQEKYLGLLQDSFSLFLQSRSAPFQKNIIEQFKQQCEDEILDLLEQCEAEEMGETAKTRQTHTLSSMPELLPPFSKSSARGNRSSSTSSNDSFDSLELSENATKPERTEKKSRFLTISKLSPEAEKVTKLVRHSSKRRRSPPRAHSAGTRRPLSKSPTPTRPSTSHSSIHDVKKKQSNTTQRSHLTGTSANVQGSSHLSNLSDGDGGRSSLIETYISSYSGAGRKINHAARQGRSRSRIGNYDFATSTVQERETELCARTLFALQNMRIKFPGKSDAEAEGILDNIMDNWKSHKSRVASYWLIKLDTSKRQKVIDIVRGNVCAVLRRTWIVSDVDSLKIMRKFNRVFNRMHANHGQGLWSCFSTSSNSWETMFSKSSETLTKCELDCCRRIVQLCKDCLLIVYQFASEAHTSSVPNNQNKYSVTHPLNEKASSKTSHGMKVNLKPVLPSRRSEIGYPKRENALHVVSGRSNGGLLSFMGNLDVTKRSIVDELAKGRNPLYEATFDSKREVKESDVPLSLENIPKRFTRATSLYSTLATDNRRHRAAISRERSAPLDLFHKPGTEYGIKT